MMIKSKDGCRTGSDKVQDHISHIVAQVEPCQSQDQPCHNGQDGYTAGKKEVPGKAVFTPGEAGDQGPEARPECKRRQHQCDDRKKFHVRGIDFGIAQAEKIEEKNVI